MTKLYQNAFTSAAKGAPIQNPRKPLRFKGSGAAFTVQSNSTPIDNTTWVQIGAAAANGYVDVNSTAGWLRVVTSGAADIVAEQLFGNADFTKAQLDAIQASVSGAVLGAGAPRVQSAVIIGDSLVANGYREVAFGGGTHYQLANRGIFDVANAMAGKPYHVLARKGTSGQTSTQVLARFDTDVTPLQPALTHLIIGTNDFDAAVTADAIFANVRAMWLKCRGWGGELLYTPQTAMNRSNAVNQQRARLHELCLEFMNANNNGFMYFNGATEVDMTGTLANAAASTPATADLAGDLTHPSSQHVAKVSAKLAAWMKNKGLTKYQNKGTPRTNATAVETWFAPSAPPGSSDGDGTVANTNGLMLGTAGTAATGFTGTVPDQHKVQRTGGGAVVTGACSIIANSARTDNRPGNLIQVASLTGFANLTQDFCWINNNASGVGFSGNQMSLANVVGKQAFGLAYANVSCSAGTLFGLWVYVEVYAADGTTILAAASGPSPLDSTSAFHNMGVSSFDGVIETPMFTIPAGAVKFSIGIKVQGNVGSTCQVQTGNFEMNVLGL